MIPEKFLYVVLYRYGKFFNCKRGHILGNVQGSHFGFKTPKNRSAHVQTKAMRGRIALQSTSCEIHAGLFHFAQVLGVRTRLRGALEQLAEELSARG
jgi:hypothetical protein